MTYETLHFHQACFYPIESVAKLKEFVSGIRETFEWEHVGLLTDERVENQVYILSSNKFQASFRLNLPDDDINDVLTLIVGNGELEVRHLQGRNLTHDELGSINSLLKVWSSCAGQSSVMSVNDVVNYISRSIEQRLKKGRGKDFKVATINQVMRDSHGWLCSSLMLILLYTSRSPLQLPEISDETGRI